MSPIKIRTLMVGLHRSWERISNLFYGYNHFKVLITDFDIDRQRVDSYNGHRYVITL